MILQLVWSFQSILYVLLHVSRWHLMTFAYFFRAGKCQPELQAESGTWWRRSFQRQTSAPGWTGFLLASCVDWILPWGWRPRVDASFCFVFTRAACLLNLPYWMTQAWLDMTYTYLYSIYIYIHNLHLPKCQNFCFFSGNCFNYTPCRSGEISQGHPGKTQVSEKMRDVLWKGYIHSWSMFI